MLLQEALVSIAITPARLLWQSISPIDIILLPPLNCLSTLQGVIPALVTLLAGMATPEEECGAASGGGHKEAPVGDDSCWSPSASSVAPRAAYIATTLRNASTLEAFVAAVQDSSELFIEDVTAELFAASPDDATSTGAVRFVDLALLEDRGRVWVHRITPLRHEAP